MATVGIKALRRIQLGQESSATAGTAVASTVKWRGVGTIKDDLETVFPEESVGIMGGTDRSYIPKLEASLSMEATEATFELLPYIFEAGIHLGTPAVDTGGTGYAYVYTLPTTGTTTPRTFTIEGGDNVAAEEMEYSIVKSFNLSGVPGEALMVSADWVGRQVSTSTFTATSIAATPTVEEILTSKGKLYLDPSSVTAGTTQITESILGLDLSVETGLTPVYTADGSLYFTFVKNSGDAMEILLDVTFEHDSQSVAQKVFWRAGTARNLRLLFQGATLTTSGAAYIYKTLNIDLAGKWDNFDKIGEQNGNDILKGQFRARYNSTAALFGVFTVVNQSSILA